MQVVLYPGQEIHCHKSCTATASAHMIRSQPMAYGRDDGPILSVMSTDDNPLIISHGHFADLWGGVGVQRMDLKGGGVWGMESFDAY